MFINLSVFFTILTFQFLGLNNKVSITKSTEQLVLGLEQRHFSSLNYATSGCSVHSFRQNISGAFQNHSYQPSRGQSSRMFKNQKIIKPAVQRAYWLGFRAVTMVLSCRVWNRTSWKFFRSYFRFISHESNQRSCS